MSFLIEIEVRGVPSLLFGMDALFMDEGVAP